MERAGDVMMLHSNDCLVTWGGHEAAIPPFVDGHQAKLSHGVEPAIPPSGDETAKSPCGDERVTLPCDDEQRMIRPSYDARARTPFGTEKATTPSHLLSELYWWRKMESSARSCYCVCWM